MIDYLNISRFFAISRQKLPFFGKILLEMEKIGNLIH